MTRSAALAVLALAAAAAPRASAGLPDPQTCEPQQIARSGARMLDVAVRGIHAYVTGDYGGLLVYEVSKPGAPALVARVGGVTPVYIEIEGDTGVLFEQLGTRLRLFSLDDPLAPSFESIIPYQISYGGFDIEGDVLVMGEGRQVRVFSIADPSAPALLFESTGLLNSFESARTILIDGDRLAIGLGPINPSPTAVRGVRFADFTDPAAPVQGALFTVPNFNGAMACSDGLCILTRSAGTGFELVVLDITDVHNPIVLGTALSPEASDIKIVGHIVHMASRSDDTSYAAFSIADPTRPTPLGQYAIAPGATLQTANRGTAIAFTDAAALIVFVRSALGALDISDPTSPRLIAQAFQADGARVIACKDGVAFVSHHGELRGIDLADPANPVGAFRDPDSNYYAQDLSIEGDLFAAACKGRGVNLYDITNARAPIHLSTIPPLLAANQDPSVSSLQGDRLYIIEGTSTKILRVMDISDPSMPVQIGVITEDQIVLNTRGFCGEYGYFTSEDGLHIWDLSDPAAPQVIAVIPRERLFDIDIDGSLMALTRWVGAGTPRPAVAELFDLSDPSNPTSISELAHTSPWGPTTRITGDRLTMLSSTEAVYDIADPRAPRLISSNINTYTNGTIYSSAAAYSEGSLLLLGTQDYLYIFDLSPCILGCAADADDSGLVDMGDLNLVLSAFNTVPGDPDWIPAADLDGDGQVAFADLNLVVGSLHTDCDPTP